MLNYISRLKPWSGPSLRPPLRHDLTEHPSCCVQIGKPYQIPASLFVEQEELLIRPGNQQEFSLDSCISSDIGRSCRDDDSCKKAYGNGRECGVRLLSLANLTALDPSGDLKSWSPDIGPAILNVEPLDLLSFPKRTEVIRADAWLIEHKTGIREHFQSWHQGGEKFCRRGDWIGRSTRAIGSGSYQEQQRDCYRLQAFLHTRSPFLLFEDLPEETSDKTVWAFKLFLLTRACQSRPRHMRVRSFHAVCRWGNQSSSLLHTRAWTPNGLFFN